MEPFTLTIPLNEYERLKKIELMHTESFARELIKAVEYFADLDLRFASHEEFAKARVAQNNINKLKYSKHYEAFSFDWIR